MNDFYKQSGVDIKAGYESVELIKRHVERTKSKGAINSIGSFGGLFDFSSLNMKNPILVSGTDGVGTKLLIAIEMDKHDTIGIDAVAMCVNDVLVQGAKPLFFLDYIALDRNEPTKVEKIVKGIADGCQISGCELVGGETAEMPDMYFEGHYDLAGFCVGAVEKESLITNGKIKKGDVLIGIASSGVHSNGFSLIRKILLKDNLLNLDSYVNEFSKTLGEELLTPTKIYVESVLDVISKCKVNGMSHITGGGFYENLSRVLHSDLGIEVFKNSLPKVSVFEYIKDYGKIPQEQMYNIFNMGIGFVLIVDEEEVTKVINILSSFGEKSFCIGRVTNGSKVSVI